MPEVCDHYIGAEILLLRGDKMARGHVVAQSCDASENVIGESHNGYHNIYLCLWVARLQN